MIKWLLSVLGTLGLLAGCYFVMDQQFPSGVTAIIGSSLLLGVAQMVYQLELITTELQKKSHIESRNRANEIRQKEHG